MIITKGKNKSNPSYLIPNREWYYQFSIHLVPTSNTKEILFTTNHRSPNDRKDKRFDIEWLKNNISPAIRNYFLDYLNPNRSKKHYFSMLIEFERDHINEPYHLHLGLTQIKNEQFFINKRTRDFFKSINIEEPDQIIDEHKMLFFEHLFRSINYREYKDLYLKSIIFNSQRAFDVRVKQKEEIMEYLSKYQKKEKYDQDFDMGVDYHNSILIPEDLKH